MHSFTVRFPGLARVLITECEISLAFMPGDKASHAMSQFSAIWDTGATGCCITQDVIDKCGLKPISITKAYGADGEYDTEVYLIALKLPNGVTASPVRVTKAKLRGADVLIGMDVISRGDFSVTAGGGVTIMSFRVPSKSQTDYCAEDKKKVGPKGKRWS